MIDWDLLSGWRLIEGLSYGLLISFGGLYLYRAYIILLLKLDIFKEADSLKILQKRIF